MAKLVFIPDWLQSELNSSGTQYDVLEKDLTSTIISQADIINYHKAQIEFFRFITGNKDYQEETYLMYNSLFVHPLPELTELSVYLQQYRDKEPAPGLMASGVGEIEQIKFTVDTQSEGRSVFITASALTNFSDGCVQTPYTVITDVLAVMHNRLRILNGTVDKSSVFRDSPLLTTLYVECLPC